LTREQSKKDLLFPKKLTYSGVFFKFFDEIVKNLVAITSKSHASISLPDRYKFLQSPKLGENLTERVDKVMRGPGFYDSLLWHRYYRSLITPRPGLFFRLKEKRYCEIALNIEKTQVTKRIERREWHTDDV
jgi:hypothetical protein